MLLPVVCVAVLLGYVHDVSASVSYWFPSERNVTENFDEKTCMKFFRMSAGYAFPFLHEDIYDSRNEFNAVTMMPYLIRVIKNDVNDILCFGFHDLACEGWSSMHQVEEEVIHLREDEVILRVIIFDNNWIYDLEGLYIRTNVQNYMFGSSGTANYGAVIGDGIRPILGVATYEIETEFNYGGQQYDTMPFFEFYMSCYPAYNYTSYEGLYTEVVEAFKNSTTEVLNVQKEYGKGKLMSLAAKSCSIYRLTGNSTFESACHLGFMLQQLKLYNKTVEGLTNHLPRSLLRISKFDSAKLLTEVNRARQFNTVIKLLGVIQETVEGTTETVVQSAEATGNYFHNLATFDKSIAEQDKLFIIGRLIQLRSGTTNKTAEITARFKRVFEVAVILTGIEMAEKAARLALAVASNLNPLKLIFGGPDINSVLDAAEELAAAARNFAKAVTLSTQVQKFIAKIEDIKQKFGENRKQLIALKKMVDTFDTAEDKDKLEMASTFVSSYGDYSPKVTMQDLTYLVDLFQNLVAAGCELIEDSNSVTGNIAAAIIENVLQDCIYLPPEVTQLGSYMEDTFAFQFELVDSLTAIVRGEIAESLSAEFQSIVNKDKYDVRLAAIGIALVEINFQKTALARCNLLEYQQGGKRPAECSVMFVPSTSIPEIIAYEGNTGTSESTRFVFMPTTPPSSNTPDQRTPFINLTQLIEAGEVNFHLPINDTDWLKQYKWLANDYQSDYNKEYSYRLKAIEAYIPGLEYNCEGTCTAPAACVFPFTYQGVTYDKCTDVASSSFWCAHNSVYVSGQWSTCDCDIPIVCTGPAACVFPFEYQGVSYDECTEVASSSAWCSHNAVYSGQWSQCTCAAQVRTDYMIGVDVMSSHPTRLFPQEDPPQYTMPSKLFRFEYSVGRECATGSPGNFSVREDTAIMTTRESERVCVESAGDIKGDSDNLLPSIFSGWTLRLRETEPNCVFVTPYENHGYHPLITFKVVIEEVFGSDINECWPTGSRCPGGTCVDGDLSFTCT